MASTTMRTIQKKINSEWITCEMKDIQSGDTFRMFEHNGEPVVSMKDGATEFVAKCDAYIMYGTVHTVQIR